MIAIGSDHGLDMAIDLDTSRHICMMDISEPAPGLGRRQWSPSPELEAVATSRAKINISLQEFLDSTLGPSKGSSPPPQYLSQTRVDGASLGKVSPVLIANVIKEIAGDVKFIKIEKWCPLDGGQEDSPYGF